MAAPLPPNRLPDPNDLVALRDRIEDYLATTERNTDAVTGWLAANKNKIIVSHQRLNRALNQKDDAAAAALLTEMGDTAGFVLGLQDFSAKAAAAFGRGKESAFITAAAAIPHGLPATLLQPLPEISPEDIETLSRIDPKSLPVRNEEDEKWLGSVASWFNKDRRHQLEKARETRQRLHNVKTEIVSLQSDRHYYIDSLMDWVADTLAPDTAENNTEKKGAEMLRYQNPAYVLRLAEEDHREALETRTAALRDAATKYSLLAEAVDGQDAADILKNIKMAYPAAPTDESALLRKLLLEDYQSLSFPDLILKHIRSRATQTELLDWALSPAQAPQQELIFSDVQKPQWVFEKFMRLTLDGKAHKPMDPKILLKVITLLRQRHDMTGEDFAFPAPVHGEKNAFQRTAIRFENDLPAQKEVLNALLTGISGKAPKALAPFMDFAAGLQQKDPALIGAALKEIRQNRTSLEFTSLWHLCHPGTSLLESLCGLSDDTKTKAALLDQGLQSGLLGEIRVAGPGTPAVSKFRQLVKTHILPALEEFPPDTARLLIAYSFQAGDMKELRNSLTKAPDSWLEKIAASGIDDAKKTEWIAALLEPFGSDVIKANILSEAARAPGPGVDTGLLTALEKNLVGENIRLTEDKILCHLQRIANIWYNADSKMLRYTVQGQAHTMLENVQPAMAGELLALIQRRGNFMQEQGGLFRPENIDTIHYSPQGTTILWYNVSGGLGSDAVTISKLKSRTDFLHVSGAGGNDIVSSYNLNSICLLQKLPDGTHLMIDKYGFARILEGKISLPKQGPLLNLGSAYFNPDNASIIRLDAAAKGFEFRVESADFEKFLEADTDEFFYKVKLPPTAQAALEKALAGSKDIHAPNNKNLANLYFNMKALGYLSYAEEANASGFYCKKYSPTRKPGFINVAPDTALDIMKGLAAKPGIISAGNLRAHRDSIDDAYYHNSGKNKLQVLIGSEIQEAAVPVADAREALTQLAQDKKFAVVASEKGASREMPVDVIQLDRATLLTLSPAQEKVNIINEHMPFYINMTANNAREFFAALEKHGLTSARRESAAAPWTKNLAAALSALPELSVCVTPLPAVHTPATLLKQALGQAPSPEKADGKLGKDFADAADVPSAYSIFSYPVRKKSAGKITPPANPSFRK